MINQVVLLGLFNILVFLLSFELQFYEILLQRCSKSTLTGMSYTKRILGFFLMVLFGFSMMPKKTIHDLFAKHKDSTGLVRDSKVDQISWAGFHCNCENLVVESPFIGEQIYPAFISFPSSGPRYNDHLTTLCCPHHNDLNLRGPPFSLNI